MFSSDWLALAHSVAPPAVLCHKEPASRIQRIVGFHAPKGPIIGALSMRRAGSLWHKRHHSNSSEKSSKSRWTTLLPSQHNKLILEGENQTGPEPRCNCQSRLRDQCPLPGRCTVTNVVYGAEVKRLDNNTTATYTGLSSPPFKSRVKGHHQDIKNYNPSDPDKHKSGTRLSRHIGELKEQNVHYRLNWKIIRETKTAYNPATNFCKLCTMEKYFIMFNPDDATLNQRSEFFSHCRHKEQHLLTKS